MNTMKKISLAIGLVILCLGYAFLSYDKNRKFISIGTASISGVYYGIGTNLCNFIVDARTSINKNIKNNSYPQYFDNIDHTAYNVFCDVRSTPGSLYNINALKRGYVNFAIIQNDWAIDRFQSYDTIQQIKKLRLLASLQEESFIIMVRGDSTIKNFYDIKNKAINYGVPGTGVRKVLDIIFDYLKWDLKKDFTITTQLRSIEQTQALCDGKIDVMFDFIGNPNGMVQEAIATCNAKMIPLNDDIIQYLVDTYPCYNDFYLTQGMYNNNTDIHTIGLKASLYTTEDTPEYLVNVMLTSIVNNIDKLQLVHPLFSGFSIKDLYPSDNIISIIPLHSGAAKFYNEKL